MNSLRLCATLAVIAALAGPACAQTRLAVDITDVTVEQLTNGLRITIKADGLLEVRSTGQWWQTNEDHEFTLWLGNARSAVGTFVDVSRYPVNYLKLETPAEAREGVGLTLTVRLYRDAHVRSVELDDQNFSWTWDWIPGDVAYDLRKSRSGNELVITVWSDRREARPGEHKTRAQQDLPEELSVQITDGLMDIEALNVPLHRLMSEVASRAGVSIYVSDRIERRVTLRLAGVQVDRFVPMLARSIGLTAVSGGGGWYVSDGLPSSLAPYTAGDSRTIRLSYLSAEQAIGLLPEFLLRYLRPGATQDVIVAHGPTRLLDRIEADIALLDRPARAVLVTTATVEATGEDSRLAMWSVLRGGSTTIDLDPADGRLRITHGDEPLEDLVASLQALSSTGRLRVDVRPSLRVEEGYYATLFVGARQYYQFLNYGYLLQLASTEAGVRLHVRPSAVGEDLVSAYVALDVSTFRGRRRPPIVDTRQASATLLLSADRSMIVAGGIRDSSAMRETAGLPGGLRGRSAKTDQTREIVFLVGAEVIPSGNPLSPPDRSQESEA